MFILYQLHSFWFNTNIQITCAHYTDETSKNTTKINNGYCIRLAVVSMAGLAAEGLEYDKVVGQSADLFTLQVIHEFIISFF